MIKTKILVLLLLLSIIGTAQTVVPIINLRNNNSSGIPVDTGVVFTVSGIVVASNHFGTSGPGAIVDQTAGIAVYGTSFAGPLQIGDSVTVTSTLVNYSGLSQLDMRRTGSSVVKHSSGHQAIPLVVTLNQIANQQWNGVEELESRLIRVNNVTITGSGNFAYANYTLTDASGSLTNGLRIDNDVTTIIGQPIPSGPVDIIGVLSQYKYAAPYSSGYQLMPRFIGDLSYEGKPTIMDPVYAADIDTNKFTVYFNTVRKGNTQVKYGVTSALEMDSVVINDDTTNHKITVNNLQPSTTYFFKAYSKNANGISESSLQKVTTATNDPNTGVINVYFNFPVDTTVSINGNKAHGEVNFEEKLIERINQAHYSIDLALYSFFGMSNVADALVLAKNRGVKVRVVYDYRNGGTVQNSMQTLLNAGIKMSRRPSASGLMHNKFFVFDGRDTLKNNDWVWTGSWNVTSTEIGWKNNVVEINDYALAQAYKLEFEEMWGSNNDDPNPSTAKFGASKTDNTPHSFNIGGRSVKLYFSPSDGTENKIIQAINTANKSIYLGMFAVTSQNLTTAAFNRYQAGATDVKGVVNEINVTGSQYNSWKNFGDMFPNPGVTMHHKYCVVDASFSDSEPIVITGSHNWSASANQDNDENTLIISDFKIANQYMQEFKKRYNDAGGTGSFVIPSDVSENSTSPNSFELLQNYPNPFNPITTIVFYIDKPQNVNLKIFDMLGKEVMTVYSGEVKTGKNIIDIDASALASGVYFYRLSGIDGVSTKKMVLMK